MSKSSHARIDALCHDLKQICNIEKHGGRSFTINESTCVLHDYDEWNSDMHDRLKELYPDATIICTHNPSSATSFSVVVTLERKNLFVLKGLMLLCVVGVTAYTTWNYLIRGLCACGCDDIYANILQCSQRN